MEQQIAYWGILGLGIMYLIFGFVSKDKEERRSCITNSNIFLVGAIIIVLLKK